MGKYIADTAIKKMVVSGLSPKNSNVVILGLTFKENCPDIRNSKVDDIIKRLKEYGVSPVIVDPWANGLEANKEYGVKLKNLEEIENADCIIIAVAHNEFKSMNLKNLLNMYKEGPNSRKVLLDVKGIIDISDLKQSGINYWRL